MKTFKILIMLALIATLASCTSPNTDESSTPPTTPTCNVVNDAPVIAPESEGVEYITTMPA